eukprot:MONOS_12104.1-p1 / transcript=MONOS_12104.1 / gene=MONOS_12104 / organism=Monocercomonoides_exilis_PA203 / gene_product=unspecified product / transcript_product=unspecified product / location=Mono_scaffold00646:3348-6251(+) / protein_length=967 / sequence_SO=supercontig / SO=protein_coding / is_pseudo=false
MTSTTLHGETPPWTVLRQSFLFADFPISSTENYHISQYVPIRLGIDSIDNIIESIKQESYMDFEIDQIPSSLSGSKPRVGIPLGLITTHDALSYTAEIYNHFEFNITFTKSKLNSNKFQILDFQVEPKSYDWFEFCNNNKSVFDGFKAREMFSLSEEEKTALKTIVVRTTKELKKSNTKNSNAKNDDTEKWMAITYRVHWTESQGSLRWSHRWIPFLRRSPSYQLPITSQPHKEYLLFPFSITFLIIGLTFLIVATIIFISLIRRLISSPSSSSNASSGFVVGGWRLLVFDAFRPPPHGLLFASSVACGRLVVCAIFSFFGVAFVGLLFGVTSKSDGGNGRAPASWWVFAVIYAIALLWVMWRNSVFRSRFLQKMYAGQKVDTIERMIAEHNQRLKVTFDAMAAEEEDNSNEREELEKAISEGKADKISVQMGLMKGKTEDNEDVDEDDILANDTAKLFPFSSSSSLQSSSLSASSSASASLQMPAVIAPPFPPSRASKSLTAASWTTAMSSSLPFTLLTSFSVQALMLLANVFFTLLDSAVYFHFMDFIVVILFSVVFFLFQTLNTLVEGRKELRERNAMDEQMKQEEKDLIEKIRDQRRAKIQPQTQLLVPTAAKDGTLSKMAASLSGMNQEKTDSANGAANGSRTFTFQDVSQTSPAFSLSDDDEEPLAPDPTLFSLSPDPFGINSASSPKYSPSNTEASSSSLQNPGQREGSVTGPSPFSSSESFATDEGEDDGVGFVELGTAGGMGDKSSYLGSTSYNLSRFHTELLSPSDKKKSCCLKCLLHTPIVTSIVSFLRIQPYPVHVNRFERLVPAAPSLLVTNWMVVSLLSLIPYVAILPDALALFSGGILIHTFMFWLLFSAKFLLFLGMCGAVATWATWISLKRENHRWWTVAFYTAFWPAVYLFVTYLLFSVISAWKKGISLFLLLTTKSIALSVIFGISGASVGVIISCWFVRKIYADISR